MLPVSGSIPFDCILRTLAGIQVALSIVNLGLPYNLFDFLLRNPTARHTASGMFSEKIFSLGVAKNIQIASSGFLRFDGRSMGRCTVGLLLQPGTVVLYAECYDEQHGKEDIWNKFLHMKTISLQFSGSLAVPV